MRRIGMSDIVIYENGTVALNAQVENETIWLSQKQMAELFGVNVPAISKHMRNMFKSKELIEKSVVSKMEITASEIASKIFCKFFLSLLRLYQIIPGNILSIQPFGIGVHCQWYQQAQY
jgi:hypothetical protein